MAFHQPFSSIDIPLKNYCFISFLLFFPYMSLNEQEQEGLDIEKNPVETPEQVNEMSIST